jgi:hypothetical protein
MFRIKKRPVAAADSAAKELEAPQERILTEMLGFRDKTEYAEKLKVDGPAGYRKKVLADYARGNRDFNVPEFWVIANEARLKPGQIVVIEYDVGGLFRGYDPTFRDPGKMALLTEAQAKPDSLYVKVDMPASRTPGTSADDETGRGRAEHPTPPKKETIVTQVMLDKVKSIRLVTI